MSGLSKETIDSFRESISVFYRGATGGRDVDKAALTLPDVTQLRAAVDAEVAKSSLRDMADRLAVRVSVLLGATFCAHQPLERQVSIALASIFFFYAEDVFERRPELLGQLQRNLALGQPLGDPVLDWFAREYVPGLWQQFNPLVANMVVLSAYDLLNGVMIEHLVQDDAVHPSAPGFPNFLREKTGLPVLGVLMTLTRPDDVAVKDGNFARIVQAIPDVVAFTNITNDVMSYYKEVAAGEKNSYMDLRAQRENTSATAVLREVVDEGLRARARALDVLKEAPAYYDNMVAFAQGIAYFHACTPRYRLGELFGEEETKDAPARPADPCPLPSTSTSTV